MAYLAAKGFGETGRLMVGYLPTLDPIQTQVLQILLDRSNIAGYDLMSITGKSSDELMPAILALRKNDLIQVVGNVTTDKDFQFSRFAVLPSARSIAGMVAKYGA